MAKNPIRHNSEIRLTNWDRETFEQKNAELKKRFKGALKELGFDAAMQVPDSVIADALLEIIWPLCRVYRTLRALAQEDARARSLSAKNVTFDDLDSFGRSQYQRILYMLYDFTNLGKRLELTKSDCNLLRVILGNPQNVDYSAYEDAITDN